MIAGMLRVISSVIPASESGIVKALYLVIDVCLLSGVLGIYGFERERLGRAGLLAAILAVGGAGLLIVRDTVAWSTNLYAFAAVIFSFGLSWLGLASWTIKKLPQWILVCWVASTLVGVFGYLVPALGLLFVLSGILLGVGFTGAGFIIWSSTKMRPAK
jgi:hypothetical protein